MSEDLFSNNLPPKRRTPLSSAVPSPNLDNLMEKKNGADQDFDIEPELLASFEQIVQNTDSHVNIDLPTNSANKITAPILENYIDPHTVPLQYLIQQAREVIKPEDLVDDESDVSLD